MSESRQVALKPASDIAAGALARAASQSTIHPLDTLKVRMQTSSRKTGVPGLSKMGQLVPPPTTSEKVSNMFAKVSTLYKGVAGAASGAGIALGAYFACYGIATNALVRHTDLPAPSVAFVAGGAAAAGSSVVKVPLAVCIRSVQANVYPNVFAAASSITAAAGPRVWPDSSLLLCVPVCAEGCRLSAPSNVCMFSREVRVFELPADACSLSFHRACSQASFPPCWRTCPTWPSSLLPTRASASCTSRSPTARPTPPRTLPWVQCRVPSQLLQPPLWT